MNARIGIDFGGVSDRKLHENRGKDTSLQNTSGLEATSDGIWQLCSASEGLVLLVSETGPRMQKQQLLRLLFCGIIGISNREILGKHTDPCRWSGSHTRNDCGYTSICLPL